MKNRAIICVFWERNGHLRRYVEYYLQHLKRISQRLIVVINGDITLESEQILKDLGLEYYCRENKGLDFGGYKYGIEKIGYNNLYKYDDLILTNTTCYGPVYPLEEMFEAMDKKDCDFWGITEHPQTRKIKKHLQSYFLVFRNSIIKSETFQKYWKNLPIISDYKKVVEKLETRLTSHFKSFGFCYSAYIPIKDNFTLNPMLITDKLLQENRLPLIKRKAICGAFKSFVGCTPINYTEKILNYLKEHTDYKIAIIYEDIINSYAMSEIRQCLGLNWCLPTDNALAKINKNKKIALILYIYYPDLVDYCLNYAQSMPENADIYIVTSREDTKKICEEKMLSFKCNHYEIRLKPNRGRDVSAYLVTCRDIFKKYDYVCCMHDKKTPTAKNNLIGESFAEHCFRSCLESKDYVKNVLSIFDNNEKIGLLCPFPPLAMGYHFWLGNEIGAANYTNLKHLYNYFNLTVPFDKTPIVPLGAMFWIRTKALKRLFSKKWEYTDFPDEPLANDGTISHAIERFYPYITQEEGYFSGYICPITIINYKTNLLLYFYRYYKYIVENNICLAQGFKWIFSIGNHFSNGRKIKILTIFGLNIRLKELKG